MQEYKLFFLRLFVYSVLGIFLLNLNPFGIETHADKFWQKVFYQLAAEKYPDTYQNNVTVVLIDESSIDALHGQGVTFANEWPIRYDDHTKIIKKIAAYGAKVIFVDLLFYRERNTDATWNTLNREMKTVAKKYNVKIIFSAGDGSPFPMKEKLLDFASLSITGWEGYADKYPLWSVDGRYNTVAYDVYRIFCLDDPEASCSSPLLDNIKPASAPLSLWWGSKPASPVLESKAKISDAQGRFFHFFGNYDEDKEGVLLPYHQTLYAEVLFDFEKKEANKQRIKGNAVFYGANLIGMHDMIYSPVHGEIPGVMLHAMATDNLITLGQNYIKGSNAYSDYMMYFVWVLSVFLTCLMLCRWEPNEEMDSGVKRMLYTYIIIPAPGALIIIFSSIAMFIYYNYEPINSITLIFMLELMMKATKHELIDKMIDVKNRAVEWYNQKVFFG